MDSTVAAELDCPSGIKYSNGPRSLPCTQTWRNGEMVADSLAYSLAPSRTRRPGEERRSFGFAGHRNIFREMNLLRRARGLVNLVLQRSPNIMSCPRRNVLWHTTMYNLNRHLWRSCLPCPPALQQAERWYFTPAASECLKQWMSEAKSAVDVRWASVLETFTKAQFENTKQLQEKLIRAGSILDKHTYGLL